MIVSKSKPAKRSSCFSFDSDEYDSDDSSFEDYRLTIGFPSDVKHIAHVTFDRFRGFLGLPKDFEQQVSNRAPSASQSVFGVVPESMQSAYDTHGNSVPTILLLLQARLYNQGGLQTEGIFRVTAGLVHEENVRSQLNNGIVPTDIDVHALAGMIKAWFRELPSGVIDSLSFEKVKMVADAQDEAGAYELANTLNETNRSLLDWSLNLMVDVVECKETNLMNAHNIATVFAPNLFQVFDPLTALVHARKVMELLKLLISRKEKDRKQDAEDERLANALQAAKAEGGLSGSAVLRPYSRPSSGVLEGKEEFVVNIRKIERQGSASRASLLAEELPAGFVNEADLQKLAPEEKDLLPLRRARSAELRSRSMHVTRSGDMTSLGKPKISIPGSESEEPAVSSSIMFSPSFISFRRNPKDSISVNSDSPSTPDFPGFRTPVPRSDREEKLFDQIAEHEPDAFAAAVGGLWKPVEGPVAAEAVADRGRVGEGEVKRSNEEQEGEEIAAGAEAVRAVADVADEKEDELADASMEAAKAGGEAEVEVHLRAMEEEHSEARVEEDSTAVQIIDLAEREGEESKFMEEAGIVEIVGCDKAEGEKQDDEVMGEVTVEESQGEDEVGVATSGEETLLEAEDGVADRVLSEEDAKKQDEVGEGEGSLVEEGVKPSLAGDDVITEMEEVRGMVAGDSTVETVEDMEEGTGQEPEAASNDTGPVDVQTEVEVEVEPEPAELSAEMAKHVDAVNGDIEESQEEDLLPTVSNGLPDYQSGVEEEQQSSQNEAKGEVEEEVLVVPASETKEKVLAVPAVEAQEETLASEAKEGVPVVPASEAEEGVLVVPSSEAREEVLVVQTSEVEDEASHTPEPSLKQVEVEGPGSIEQSVSLAEGGLAEFRHDSGSQ